MEQQLKDLKSVLRSLVVSSPTQVDVRSLLRDYRNMMGTPIPLTRYGYKDPVLFLKERFSDCFVFQGPSINPILTLIVPENLKHIDKFVQSQKLSSSVKFKGKRRSIPGQMISQSNNNLIVNTFKPAAPVAVVNKTKQTEPAKPSQKLVNNNSGLEYSSPQRADKIARPITKSISNVRISDKENEQSNNVIKSSTANDAPCSSEALQKFLKKRLPMYNSLSCIENGHEEASNSERTSSRDDADSGRQTLSSSSSAKAAKLEKLKSEILGLIENHPEGILCTDLMRLYRERYGRELEFSRFGYTSIISLVLAMEAAVRATPNEAGNWLLTDPRAAPPPPRPRRAPRPRPPSMAPVDPDDALPGIDFDPGVFPSDCMHFAESIPAGRLEGVGAGDLLEVMVGEVYSPSHFWLLRLGPDHYERMCDIMDEMTKYYTWGAGRERSLALGAVRVGHYCTSVFERDWHRSLIVRILDSDTVKVRHVDYGTVETVKVSALKPLLRKWAELPAQAIRARLAGVCPAARGRRWTHAASAHFLRLVSDARLVANVVGVHAEDDILEVFLVNTLTEDDILIDKELVRSGHADACADSQAAHAACYLLPRFNALENGDTPNFSDIHGYLRDGIALEFVDDYRRHVPSCLPPLSPAPDAAPEPAPPSPAPSPAPSTAPPSPAPSVSSTMSEDSFQQASPVAPAAATRASAPEFVPPPPHPPAPAPAPAAASAPADVFNRVPLMQPPPMPSPPPAHAFRHLRPPPPPPHPYHSMMPMQPMQPMHSFGSFSPFPGAVPFYPPVCPRPMPMFMPGPPGPHGAHSFQNLHHPTVSRTASCFFRPDVNQPPPPPSPRDGPPPRPSAGGVPHPAAPPSPAGGVTLTAAECEVFEVLCKANPEIAQKFMADAISRAMRGATAGAPPSASTAGGAPGAGAGAGAGAATTGGASVVTSTVVATSTCVRSSLNPEAAEFRLVAAGTQTEPGLLPFKLEPLPPGMRPPPGLPPPPGFGSRMHLA